MKRARRPFDWTSALESEFPGQDHRFFEPMSIGGATSATSVADEGAAAILSGIKTTTSSAFWHFPDGRIPFKGALSVLLDGRGCGRAIVGTQNVQIRPFAFVDEDFARAYGEGDRTLRWWREAMGAWYRDEASRVGTEFSDETLIICEWIAIVRRL